MINIENIDSIAQEILNTCGGQTSLCIGSGNRQLAQKLLNHGINAYGLDESFKSVHFSNSLMPGRFKQGNLKKIPYANKTFNTTIVLYSFEHLDHQELSKAIEELNRVTCRSVYLRIKTDYALNHEIKQGVLDRNSWENLFFNHKFRKHPSYYLLNDYNALDRESGEAIILLECISNKASESYPLEALKEKRDLHMDMTRESGERSDAHIARYQWAATFVRPGDTVLDAACGLGYGSYILQCNTRALKTIGIDSSNYAIDYANINFNTSVNNLNFLVGTLPEALNKIPNNSIDIIVSFETLEHLLDPEKVLKEFYRVLTPAGRIIVSVPNDWSDQTGKDPNHLHIHVYTLDKLRNQLKDLFDLEKLFAQSATHYKEFTGSINWVSAKREFYEIDTSISEVVAPPSEWWIAVGMKSPLNVENAIYHETQHKRFTKSEWNVTSFARDYKNPWLLRGMVDIGWRQKNKVLLSKLVEQVIDINHDNSADLGAALCVKGYQLLNNKQATLDILNSYIERVNEYITNQSDKPHVIRWTISLHFVIAKLWLQAGMHDRARSSFMRCVEIDPLKFSPLLANRTVESYLFLGKLFININDENSARKAWIAGIASAQRAVTTDWHLSLGDLHAPAEFALPELSSILDYASNCAYALINLKDFKNKPWWWLHLQRSPRAQFNAQKIQINSLKSQILSLNHFACSLRETTQKQTMQLSEYEHRIQIQKKELAKFKNIINTKDMLINEQTVKLREFNAIMQTRLVKLRNIILYQPWGVRKVMHIAYLTISLFTPRVLRNKLQPITNWLHNHFHQSNSPAKISSKQLISNRYYVKKPITKCEASKIVHIIANFMTGGSSRLVLDLVEYLGDEYEQCVLTRYIPNSSLYIGLDIEKQSDDQDIVPFINYLKRKQPDLIHVHYWGNVDKTWYMQAIEAAKILNIPVIENINTPIAPYMSDIVQKYVYVSNYVRNTFGRSDSNHVTVYPGSDFSHFMRTDDELVPLNCVGMVYRLEYDKLNKDSIRPFIIIAQKRPKTKNLIVGGGSLLNIFQKAVKRAGVEEQFEFTGYVDYNMLPNYYRRMSLFLAPVWQESFGQVVPFAMSMRVPVIGYDIGAISEIINSKKMLASSGDAENLANIAVKLLNNNELREQIGREHKQRAKEYFSIQTMIETYSKLYAAMVKK